MKHFLPYASLTEQSSFIEKMLEERKNSVKPILSEEQEEEINYILTHYLDHVLKISYYDHYIKEIEGVITKLSEVNQTITCQNKTIPLNAITSILVKQKA